jgi:small subunit ribosomal protein S16
MLVIRMQRTGRKGHAMFRVVVQDSRRTPTSGKLVARLGSYDPHAKTLIVDKEKAKFYLDHGAQPSDRVARMLKSEGVKLPEWVAAPETKQRTVKNADKRRSTRPDVPAEETPAEPETPPEAETIAVAETAETEAPAAEPEVPASEPEETTAEPAEEVKEEVEVTDAAPDSAPKEEAAAEQTADTPEQTEKNA